MDKTSIKFQRGYNLADTYIKNGNKNIESVSIKNEEFKAGYFQRIEEEKIKKL